MSLATPYVIKISCDTSELDAAIAKAKELRVLLSDLKPQGVLTVRQCGCALDIRCRCPKRSWNA